MSWGGLVFDPILAPLIGWQAAAWLAALVAVLAVLALAVALWRGLRGAWWRGLALGLIAAALAGPGLERGTARPLSDIVLLVDDRSASQTLPGRREQADAAMARIEEQLGQWPGTEIRRITLGDAEDGTLLGAALSRAIAEEPANRLSGVLVLSDGLAHDGAALPATAPAPVHLLQTGTPEDWDRRIVIDEAPRFALIGKPVIIRLHIADEGAVPDAAHAPTQLRVSLDGKEINSVAVVPGTRIELPVTFDTAGPNVLLLSLDDQPGELTTINNRMALSVNAVRDRLRVLLVSGEPNPGERTWRNLLKSDANVDLIHFTILRPPEKFDGVPVNELALIRFPTEELFMERIRDFDLIIFDRYRMRGILLPQYYDNIRRYVEEGGAVLVSAGPEFAGVESIARSSLGEILPARPSGRLIETPFTPRLTEAGRRHPVTEDLPGAPPEDGTVEPGETWGRWLRMIETFPAPDSTIAMIGEGNRPLLMLRRQGEGRVALIASDQLWLWGRGFEGGGPQLDLMRRVAHWSMKEPELEEEALDLRATGQVLDITRRSLGEIDTPAQVTGPDGALAEVVLEEQRPGHFTGRYPAGVPGLYSVRQGDLTRSIVIGPASPREFDRTVANPAELAGLIEATGGSVQPLSEDIPDLRRVEAGRPTQGQGIARPWIGLVARDAETVTGLSRNPILPGWAWLLLIAGATLTGWLLEGRRRA
ncbi:MAG TPA: hypothetical protein PKC09_08145 [Paracoccus sp. (in: a-proteobacteria)]|mgnify:CR=1 FL=1|uniref:hypothetical protein n=1 Tax=uncultured Paracoccus sp. TaxID=189685 RepID=UPI0026316BB9|nr:hypothetical protein [uncultured Paracoccus sp.]HMQ41228.1 hypothetical protein [Paracoccus sp. (in: a-proteobacteria)]HMR35403.1 hypothetical protein [Paracoccus sp. (in: a-proteobacteria)]